MHCFMAIRQFVLHGLPTTRTRASAAALFWIACPCPVKIFPLMPRRSPRSIPALRGTLPTSKDQLAPEKPSLISHVGRMSLSKGKAPSSSSMTTPSSAFIPGSISMRLRATGWIRAEKPAGGDAKQERIANLASGAGYGHANGCGIVHKFVKILMISLARGSNEAVLRKTSLIHYIGRPPKASLGRLPIDTTVGYGYAILELIERTGE